MSEAIETLREHFNKRPVRNSKVLMEERDSVNAMIDSVEAENARLREYAKWLEGLALIDPNYYRDVKFELQMKKRELGIEEI